MNANHTTSPAWHVADSIAIDMIESAVPQDNYLQEPRNFRFTAATEF